MSKFCGKCDFYDHLWMSNDTEEVIKELQKTDVYIYGKDRRRHKVEVNTIKDAAKYYPYIIAISASDKNHRFIILSSNSFIDEEEEEFLGFDINAVIRYWKKCKRNKEKFDKNKCYEEIIWGNKENPVLREIINRIEKNGDKADFSDIHLSSFERHRKDWYEELVGLGYTKREAFEWCFNECFATNEKALERLGEEIE